MKNISFKGKEEVQKVYTSSISIQRYGEPEEVANVSFFLLSDDSSCVTNSICTVDAA